MVIRRLAIPEFRKQQPNSNTMHIGLDGEETWNSLYAGATLVADTEKVQLDLKVP